MAWDRRRRGPREHASYPDVRERLTEAFKAMRKKGILARQNFSCCTSCGSSELAVMITARGGDPATAKVVVQERCETEGVRVRFTRR